VRTVNYRAGEQDLASLERGEVRKLVVAAAVGLSAFVGLSSTAAAVSRAAVMPSPSCTQTPPRGLPSAPQTRQFISVTAPVASSTRGTLSTYGRTGDCWSLAYGPFSVRLGAHGLSATRHEGDETTPIGVFSIGMTMYGNGPNPGVRYHYVQLHCGSWWDENPRSATYNLFVQLPCGTSPRFGTASSETLWRQPKAYRSFAVINFNPHRVAGMGSGIFLHGETGSATAGCVALSPANLVKVLTWLQPTSNPVISLSVVTVQPH